MRKKKKWLAPLGVFALALFGIGVVGLTPETRTASAAVSTTAKYTTYGSTNNGSSISSGCPSNFTIYMYGSSQSGTATMYQDALTNWSYYNIYIDAIKVSDHRSFVLRRNGSSYYTKSVSGESDMYLYQGSLPDGEYELEYTCRYAKNIFYDKTQDRFIGGNSMGGYGAIKIALKECGRYAAAFGLSSVANIRNENFTELLRSIHGDEISAEDDLYTLADIREQAEGKPRLYMTVGKDDFMYLDNVAFGAYMQKKDYDFTYVETEGGHSWDVWDKTVQDAMEWMLQ